MFANIDAGQDGNQMRAKVAAAVLIVLAVAGGLCVWASYLFCSSWYADEGLPYIPYE